MAIKRCKSPFSVWNNGVPRVITGGQLIEDTDPVYKTHGHLFEDVETFVSDTAARASGVERATAEPGEKRSLFAPDDRRRPAGEVHNDGPEPGKAESAAARKAAPAKKTSAKKAAPPPAKD
ncbi:hypothetical protein [Streptomyces canus]|uniref:hypothetical protein n=1 Tax=Streptomyces canus TaxID=58343 RepID=UPI003CFAC13D